MKYEYPLLIQKIKNAENMIDGKSEYEEEKTEYAENVIAWAQSIVNIIEVSDLVVDPSSAADYASLVTGLLSQSFLPYRFHFSL